MNGMACKFNFKSLDSVNPDLIAQYTGPLPDIMSGILEMSKESSEFFKLADEMKIIFTLRDDAYMYIDIKMPGFADYLDYLGETFD